jgi:murein DD-endopeptidase MepM/ murein hydrolase activator NlpD
MCGSRTYIDHDGTDFRLKTMAQQRRGVDVLAAAAGRVVGGRDEVPDISVRVRGALAVKGQECGNGVLIDHGGGWHTQILPHGQGQRHGEGG